MPEPVSPREVSRYFTSFRGFEAEGARVALMSCLVCGAAVLLDPDDADKNLDLPAMHVAWHKTASDVDSLHITTEAGTDVA